MSEENELSPWSTVAELKENRDFWERQAAHHRKEAEYYQEQLVQAHALLGRVVHQTSERWDRVNLTKHFPTDNLHARRSYNNPGGETQQ